MEKIVETYEEMVSFASPLVEQERYIVDIRPIEGTTRYRIQWLEHKPYSTLDGKEFLDEVWTNKAGDIMLVQDMSEAHVKNAFRMLLRNRRLADEALAAVASALKEVLENDSVDDSGDEDDTVADETTHISTKTGKVIH